MTKYKINQKRKSWLKCIGVSLNGENKTNYNYSDHCGRVSCGIIKFPFEALEKARGMQSKQLIGFKNYSGSKIWQNNYYVYLKRIKDKKIGHSIFKRSNLV